MAVFRVERTRDYTVMSNYHLSDKSISSEDESEMRKVISAVMNM